MLKILLLLFLAVVCGQTPTTALPINYLQSGKSVGFVQIRKFSSFEDPYLDITDADTSGNCQYRITLCRNFPGLPIDSVEGCHLVLPMTKAVNRRYLTPPSHAFQDGVFFFNVEISPIDAGGPSMENCSVFVQDLQGVCSTKGYGPNCAPASTMPNFDLTTVAPGSTVYWAINVLFAGTLGALNITLSFALDAEAVVQATLEGVNSLSGTADVNATVGPSGLVNLLFDDVVYNATYMVSVTSVDSKPFVILNSSYSIVNCVHNPVGIGCADADAIEFQPVPGAPSFNFSVSNSEKCVDLWCYYAIFFDDNTKSQNLFVSSPSDGASFYFSRNSNPSDKPGQFSTGLKLPFTSSYNTGIPPYSEFLARLGVKLESADSQVTVVFSALRDGSIHSSSPAADTGLFPGQIAGIVIGVILSVSLIAIVIILFLRRKKKQYTTL